MKILLSVFLTLLITPESFANIIKDICDKTGLPVILLKPKQREANIKKIVAEVKGDHPQAKFMKKFYGAHRSVKALPPEAKQVKLSIYQNRKNLKPSETLKSFMAYTTQAKRRKNPRGFINTILKAIYIHLPHQKKNFDEYFNLKHPNIVKQTIVSVDELKKGIGNTYGAITKAIKEGKNRYSTQIVVSSYSTETIPYLMTLLIHELVHGKTTVAKMQMGNGDDYYTKVFIEEALAYEKQVMAYHELIKKDPDLFCNYVYPTYTYGQTLVPLSWTMASMEEEMRNGDLLLFVADTPIYKGQKAIKNSKTNRLTRDVRFGIKSLKLKILKIKK